MNDIPDNLSIYDRGWQSWLDMKRHGPASRWLRDLIQDAAQRLDEAPESVHDVGCGVGTNTAFLAEMFPGASVLGSDFSSTAIAVASRYNLLSSVRYQHDADDTAPNLPADLVCCFEVLEHVDDWLRFLDRLANSSRRHLLLSFPTGRMRPFEANIGHLRNFEPGVVENALLERGFEPVSVAYAGFPFYSPLYRDVCQLTDAGAASFTQGEYGRGKRALSQLIYITFRHLSTQRRFGDQFVGLFRRIPPR